jgi:hypothetical protein
VPGSTSYEQAAHLVDPAELETINVLGPTIQHLTEPGELSAPCIMRGTIPAGMSVPLHSHADPKRSSCSRVPLMRSSAQTASSSASGSTRAPSVTCQAMRNTRGETGVRRRRDDHRQHFQIGPLPSRNRQTARARCAARTSVRGGDPALSRCGGEVWVLECDARTECANRDSRVNFSRRVLQPRVTRTERT